MPRVDIGRYQHPESVGWQGWISWLGWVVFVGFDRLDVYQTDKETGVVIGAPITVSV